jgi:hypothetical protein
LNINVKGPDLAAVITEDKIPIGFSLRALGSLEERDGTLYVKAPFKAITYDCVSNPSHAEAKILTFLPESVNEYIPAGANIMYENEDLGYINTDGLQLFESGSPEVIQFLDDIINEHFLSVISKKVEFRIK